MLKNGDVGVRTWGHLEVTGEAILNESLDRLQARNCSCDGLGSEVEPSQ